MSSLLVCIDNIEEAQKIKKTKEKLNNTKMDQKNFEKRFTKNTLEKLNIDYKGDSGPVLNPSKEQVSLKSTSRATKKNSKKLTPVRVPRGHWSLWKYYIFLFLSLSLMAACLFSAARLSLDGSSMLSGIVVFVGLPASIFAVGALLILSVIKLNNSKFELRSGCLRHVTGRYAIRQNVIEIPYEDIGWVRVTQNIVERFLNVGSIEVGAAHSHLPEIVAEGRNDPHKYAAKIYKRMSKTRRKESNKQYH